MTTDHDRARNAFPGAFNSDGTPTQADRLAEQINEVMRLANAYAVACVDFEKASVAYAVAHELRATMLCAEKALQASVAALAKQQASPEVSAMQLAVIGRNHFGNPIPREWYAAARELLSTTPSAPQAAGVVVKAEMLGATGHCLQMLESMNDFPIGTKFYAHPPQVREQAALPATSEDMQVYDAMAARYLRESAPAAGVSDSLPALATDTPFDQAVAEYAFSAWHHDTKGMRMGYILLRDLFAGVGEQAQAEPPAIQSVMFEVYEYAKRMDGFDALEGDERVARRVYAQRQANRIRELLAILAEAGIKEKT